MSTELTKCKVTVIKRMINQDLIDEYLDPEYKDLGLCEVFHNNQEILIDDYYGVPEGFCPSAWADIRSDLMAVMMGSSMPGINRPGTLISSCQEWFRPVIFRIERLESD